MDSLIYILICLIILLVVSVPLWYWVKKDKQYTRIAYISSFSTGILVMIAFLTLMVSYHAYDLSKELREDNLFYSSTLNRPYINIYKFEVDDGAKIITYFLKNVGKVPGRIFNVKGNLEINGEKICLNFGEKELILFPDEEKIIVSDKINKDITLKNNKIQSSLFLNYSYLDKSRDMGWFTEVKREVVEDFIRKDPYYRSAILEIKAQ